MRYRPQPADDVGFDSIASDKTAPVRIRSEMAVRARVIGPRQAHVEGYRFPALLFSAML